MKNTINIHGTIQKETEKAINVQVYWSHPESMKKCNWTVWMPKSQVTVQENTEASDWLGNVIISTPEWLANKVAAQIGDFINNRIIGTSVFSL